MLNPFPIQFLALFAYFIVRVCVAGILLYLGYKHWRHRRELADVLQRSWFRYGSFTAVGLALAEVILGALLLVGAHTQYVALALIAMSFKMLVMRSWFQHSTIPPRIFYALLLGVSISLLINGAGVFAVDLPF